MESLTEVVNESIVRNITRKIILVFNNMTDIMGYPRSIQIVQTVAILNCWPLVLWPTVQQFKCL